MLIIGTVFAGAIVIWSFRSIQGGQRTYEVQPKITFPGYGTDEVRLLDAYERLMERYMDLVERNLKDIDSDIKKTTAQIDSIDTKLKELCERTARIEKALGIEQSNEVAQKPLGSRQVNRDRQMRQEGQN